MAADPTHRRFQTNLVQLSSLLGLMGDSADWSDEHSRWRLYEEAMRREGTEELLFDTIGYEPVASVALSVVLRMLESDGRVSDRDWVGRLRDEVSQIYAASRLQDLNRFDQIESGDEVDLNTSAIESFSEWLQLRLAERSTNSSALILLANDGRTKRIRRVSSDRAVPN